MAKTVGQGYEVTRIAEKPSVAQDNEERKEFDRAAEQRESDGKRMIQRL